MLAQESVRTCARLAYFDPPLWRVFSLVEVTMMKESPVLTVNGKPHPHVPGMTVALLLTEVYTLKGVVVVEVNGVIIEAARHGVTPLNAGDCVEIVQFVGGG